MAKSRKSKKGTSGAKQSASRTQRRIRTQQIIFGVIALLIILSMALSMIRF